MNNKALLERPWLKGSLELLKHAVFHFRQGTPADLRFAMIHTDNAIELAGRLYLKMEVRLQDTLSPNEVKELDRYFDKLLKHLSSQLAWDNMTLSKIEYFHEIRNDLYHNGNGISVIPEIVSSYITTASHLLEQMYGINFSQSEKVPETELVSSVVTKNAGELPPERVNHYNREFLAMIVMESLSIAVQLRYAIMGYQTDIESSLRKDMKETIKEHFICRKDEETVFVVIVNLDRIDDWSILMIVEQSKRIQRDLPAEQRSTAKYRLHTITTPKRHPYSMEEDNQRMKMLEQAGWEIEDWKTTLKILSDNGLSEQAEPLKKNVEEYMTRKGA
jgi:hypothetical protein